MPADGFLRHRGLIALAVGGAVIGEKSKIPAGALLVPMVVGVVLSGSRVVTRDSGTGDGSRRSIRTSHRARFATRMSHPKLRCNRQLDPAGIRTSS